MMRNDNTTEHIQEQYNRLVAVMHLLQEKFDMLFDEMREIEHSIRQHEAEKTVHNIHSVLQHQRDAK